MPSFDSQSPKLSSFISEGTRLHLCSELRTKAVLSHCLGEDVRCLKELVSLRGACRALDNEHHRDDNSSRGHDKHACCARSGCSAVRLGCGATILCKMDWRSHIAPFQF